MNLLLIISNFVQNLLTMRLTGEQKINLINDYKNGITWNDLCIKYKTNLHTIHKLLKENNIKKARVQENSWSVEKQAIFKKMYLENSTYKEMYEKLNCKGGTLTYWVHKLNLPMRGSGRNNVYPNKFKEHTIESDYWLGYIFADGHITYSNRQYNVQLASEKEYVVQKFKAWYNSIPIIHTSLYTLKDGTKKTMYTAIIYSKEIASWFTYTVGISSKKHHNLNPNIAINWDIIRGFFDGDGSSSKGEWQLKSCSKIWLQRIQEFLKAYDIKSHLKLSYLDCWGLYIYDKENLKKVISLMYQNNYYCHQYKYNNFEPLISNNKVNMG